MKFKPEDYLALAHIAGEIWGTQARAHMVPTQPGAAVTVLGHDIYFVILNQLKADFKAEVTYETETPDGEDD